MGNKPPTYQAVLKADAPIFVKFGSVYDGVWVPCLVEEDVDVLFVGKCYVKSNFGKEYLIINDLNNLIKLDCKRKDVIGIKMNSDKKSISYLRKKDDNRIDSNIEKINCRPNGLISCIKLSSSKYNFPIKLKIGTYLKPVDENEPIILLGPNNINDFSFTLK